MGPENYSKPVVHCNKKSRRWHQIMLLVYTYGFKLQVVYSQRPPAEAMLLDPTGRTFFPRPNYTVNIATPENDCVLIFTFNKFWARSIFSIRIYEYRT